MLKKGKAAHWSRVMPPFRWEASPVRCLSGQPLSFFLTGLRVNVNSKKQKGGKR